MAAAATAREWAFYVAVGAGMALSTSAFTMMAGLFAVVPLGPLLLALAIAAAMCAVIALSIGELASLWPSSPAILTYFRMAFGPDVALLLVHLYLVFIILIAGVESYAFALVVGAVWPAAPPAATICLLLAAVVAVNLRGLELPRRVQIVTAFGTVAVLVCLSVAGLAEAPSPRAGAAVGLDGAANLPAAVGLAVFLFTGFEWVTPVGLSREAYARRVPLSMPAAIAVLLVTYGLFALAVGTVLPRGEAAAAATPQVAYFAALLGPAGTLVALLLTLGAIFSTFNAGIMGGARLLQAVARERLLPGWVAFVDVRTGAPVGAVLLLGGLALVSALAVAALDAYLAAAIVGSAIIALIYTAYLLAVERLRRSLPDRPRPFRTRLPRVVRWAMIGLMPAIGAATLVSLPDLRGTLVAGFLAALILVALLAAYSDRRALRTAPRRVRAAE